MNDNVCALLTNVLHMYEIRLVLYKHIVLCSNSDVRRMMFHFVNFKQWLIFFRRLISPRIGKEILLMLEEIGD